MFKSLDNDLWFVSANPVHVLQVQEVHHFRFPPTLSSPTRYGRLILGGHWYSKKGDPCARSKMTIGISG